MLLSRGKVGGCGKGKGKGKGFQKGFKGKGFENGPYGKGFNPGFKGYNGMNFKGYKANPWNNVINDDPSPMSGGKNGNMMG